jgi:hypothetical protein
METNKQIIKDYKLCSNVSFESIFMNQRNEDGTENRLFYINTTKQYYDIVQAEERQNTKIQNYDIDGMATVLFFISRQLFQNINFAKKENAVSGTACLFGHQKIKPHFDFLKTVVTSIRYIGQSNPVDMIDMSRYYLDLIRAFYGRMEHYQIDLKTSPLEPYFKELVSELNELCSNKRIKNEKAIVKLKNSQVSKAKRIFPELQSMNFFKIYFEKQIKDTDLSMFSEEEVEKLDTNKVINIFNNDSFITTENWNDRKDTFFNQRMETYKDSYTINEKIVLELKHLENIEPSKQENEILKSRYIEYLNNKLELPQQEKTNKAKDVKKELHNHIFKGNAFEVLEKYFANKNVTEQSKTDLSVLYQLMKADNLIRETVELVNFIKWLNITFDYSLIEIRKANLNNRPNIKRENDYKEYKTTTLK